MEEAELNEKKLDHEIKLQDKQYEDHWRSCVGITTDRRLLEFGARFLISITVLTFSLVQLTQEDNDLQTYWCSLITFIVGLNTNNSPENKKLKK